MNNKLQARADKLVQNEVFCHVGALVEELAEKTEHQFIFDNFNPDPTDEQVRERMESNGVENLPELNDVGNFESKALEDNSDLLDAYETARDELRDEWEPLEYWAVSEWLAKKLQERGEVVAEIGLMYIWARTTSGQAIAIDYVIEQITEATEYARSLEDEDNKIAITWSIEDVKSLDASLTDEQAREVLHNFSRHHDGSMEQMWLDLQYHVDEFHREQPAA